MHRTHTHRRSADKERPSKACLEAVPKGVSMSTFRAETLRVLTSLVEMKLETTLHAMPKRIISSENEDDGYQKGKHSPLRALELEKARILLLDRNQHHWTGQMSNSVGKNDRKTPKIIVAVDFTEDTIYIEEFLARAKCRLCHADGAYGIIAPADEALVFRSNRLCWKCLKECFDVVMPV